MTDLAVLQDVIDRSPRTLTSAEQTRAGVLLGDASAKIRGYTNQTFTAVTDDVVELRPVGMRIRLPEVPVTAVSSVVAIGWLSGSDVTLPQGTWAWDGIDIIQIAPFSENTWINLPQIDIWGYPDTYRVTYSHGDATVPDLVVAVCAGMVLRVILAPSASEGMSSEHIGQYSYQFSQQIGGGSPGVSVRLTEADKEELRRAGYGPRNATTIQLVL